MLKWIGSVLTGILVAVAGSFAAQYAGLIKISWPVRTDELPNEKAVFSKAAEILNRADKEVVVFIDFPSSGTVSVRDPEYRNAFESVLTNNKIKKTLVWLNKDAEKRVANEVEDLSDNDKKTVLAESEQIRRLANGHSIDSNSHLLGYLNYWLSCSSSGNCEAVVTLLDEPPKSKGFYTNSPEVAKLLQDLLPVMSRRASIDQKYCLAVSKPPEPEPATFNPPKADQYAPNPATEPANKRRRGANPHSDEHR